MVKRLTKITVNVVGIIATVNCIHTVAVDTMCVDSREVAIVYILSFYIEGNIKFCKKSVRLLTTITKLIFLPLNF